MSSPVPALAGLSAFLTASPTPYQMCAHAGRRLLAAGFTELREEDSWAKQSALKKGGRYFFTRAASTLVAFSVGGAFEPGNGFKVVGAHTDSPVLKVKPVSKKSASGYQQLGVECCKCVCERVCLEERGHIAIADTRDPPLFSK